MALRALAYRLGWLRAERLPVPVLVVGNLTAGGAGKTPLTLALAAWLRDAGYRPGIVSRGHGGSSSSPMAVLADTDPVLAGDEPVLMARRAGCPVWVGRRRADAARRLLAAHPRVNVLLADDGLQHLALARDMEIVVVDGGRGLGNGWMLPAGPLREPPARLGRVTAVVVNGQEGVPLPWSGPTYPMRLRGGRLRNLLDPDRELPAAALAETPVQALAGIGHPERFFGHLRGLGLRVVPHPFPDHHAYTAADLPPGRLVMTEKDAVKIAPLARARDLADAWVLAVDAEVAPGLKDLILSRLRDLHGPQTA